MTTPGNPSPQPPEQPVGGHAHQPQNPYDQQTGYGQQQNPYAQQNPYGQRGFQDAPQQAQRVGQKAFGFLRPVDWAQSAVIAGIAYLGMALVAIVFVAVLGAALGHDAEGALGSSGSSDGLDMLDGHVSGYMFFALIFQMVAMGMGGTLRLRAHASASAYDIDETMQATVHLMPLLLALVGALLIFFASRFVARRSLSRGAQVRTRDIWMASLVTGVVLTVLVVVLTMVFAGRSSLGVMGVDAKLHVWALSWHLFFYPWVFATLIGVWGRRSVMAPMPSKGSDVVNQALPGFGLAGRLVGLYAGSVCTVALIVLSIVAGAKNGVSSFFGCLFFGMFMVVDFLTMGHLGAVADKYSGQSDYSYIWSDSTTDALTHWPMLIWIGVVLGILLVALAWAGRRPQLNNVGSWFVMPVVFFLLGVLAIWAGSLRAGGSGWGESGSVVVGPAWWTPVVFLIWGVVVEVLARYVMPLLARSIPGSVGRFLVGRSEVLAFSPAHRYSGNPEAQQQYEARKQARRQRNQQNQYPQFQQYPQQPTQPGPYEQQGQPMQQGGQQQYQQFSPQGQQFQNPQFQNQQFSGQQTPYQQNQYSQTPYPQQGQQVPQQQVPPMTPQQAPDQGLTDGGSAGTGSTASGQEEASGS